MGQLRMRDAGNSNGMETCTSRRQDKEGAEQSQGPAPSPVICGSACTAPASPSITREKGSCLPTLSCGSRVCKKLSLVGGRKRLDQSGTSSPRADRLCSGSVRAWQSHDLRINPPQAVTCQLFSPERGDMSRGWARRDARSCAWQLPGSSASTQEASQPSGHLYPCLHT